MRSSRCSPPSRWTTVRSMPTTTSGRWRDRSPAGDASTRSNGWPTPPDPKSLDWILREGFRNSVMDEYLAYLAATRGGVLDRLRSDYLDGAEATRTFIGLLMARAADLRHVTAADMVR